jgi:hypothetical protein
VGKLLLLKVFYLSGGFYSGWQQRLVRECAGLRAVNPETDGRQNAVYAVEVSTKLRPLASLKG